MYLMITNQHDSVFFFDSDNLTEINTIYIYKNNIDL